LGGWVNLGYNTWKCHNETPCSGILNKEKTFCQKWRTGCGLFIHVIAMQKYL
jgi:hypothetical protein